MVPSPAPPGAASSMSPSASSARSGASSPARGSSAGAARRPRLSGEAGASAAAGASSDGASSGGSFRVLAFAAASMIVAASSSFCESHGGSLSALTRLSNDEFLEKDPLVRFLDEALNQLPTAVSRPCLDDLVWRSAEDSLSMLTTAPCSSSLAITLFIARRSLASLPRRPMMSSHCVLTAMWRMRSRTSAPDTGDAVVAMRMMLCVRSMR
mmetsp:Transcript_25194/g.86274  ORF Transcript_25194/g.86274 Transcript_25194/m.86274 type:complete len:211 (-) Transcript_25194:4138-4770(-)